MLEDGHLFAVGLWSSKYEPTQQPVLLDSLRAPVIKERFVQVIFFTTQKCFNSRCEHWCNSLVIFQREEQNELVLNIRNKSLLLPYTHLIQLHCTEHSKNVLLCMKRRIIFCCKRGRSGRWGTGYYHFGYYCAYHKRWS